MRLILVGNIHSTDTETPPARASSGNLEPTESRLALNHSLTGHTRNAAKPPRPLSSALGFFGQVIDLIKRNNQIRTSPRFGPPISLTGRRDEVVGRGFVGITVMYSTARIGAVEWTGRVYDTVHPHAAERDAVLLPLLHTTVLLWNGGMEGRSGYTTTAGTLPATLGTPSARAAAYLHRRTITVLAAQQDSPTQYVPSPSEIRARQIPPGACVPPSAEGSVTLRHHLRAGPGKPHDWTGQQAKSDARAQPLEALAFTSRIPFSVLKR
ncbi:hypothetical protein V490_08155 [Pseudogymnoascus sp. VKM F-3557]|nr:hypothetical protein V490_08155 [Pseudogymnoascus sp. VKM F-3557]